VSLDGHGDSACPHCGLPYPYDRPHVCEDRDPWTKAERDRWRERALRLSPALRFVRTYDNAQEAPVRRGRLRDLRTPS
jgi:hypothetical protein